jgi:hypothetical protein
MEFKEVTTLVFGTKYKVVHYYHEYVATYKRSFNYNPVILTFSSNKQDYHQYLFPGFNPYTYYVPIFRKERIQQAMEERALQRILKNLIDESFSW